MKWRIIAPVLSFLTKGIYAFPGYTDSIVTEGAFSKLSAELDAVARNFHQNKARSNPLTTPIEVHGDHKFIPPDFENGAQRGPCPALNALANHGYINRKGITSLVEVTGAINQVFGMALDLAAVLGVMGTVFVGNPLSLDPGFSIGHTTSGSQNILGNLFGLLGTPRGLNGSHNIIEGDSSNTRGDLYVTGDPSTMVLEQFQSLYDMSPGEGDYDFGIFARRAAIRFHETVATNPNFYFGPFTGLIARNAGYLFACRIFANHSAENPFGILNKETLKSFHGVQGEESHLTYNKGWERIPENWYRRPVDYGLVELNLDTIALVLKYPELGSIGGNLGSVNSYAGVDISNITGGVLNAEKLLEGNNLLCFVFEVVKTVAPNSLSTIFSLVAEPLKLVLDTLGVALLNLSCPAFEDLTIGGKNFQEGALGKFPGARLSGFVL